MSLDDVRKECVGGSWVPILVIEHNGEKIIPVFERTDIARRFVQRNLPRAWVCGVVDLDMDDAKRLDEMGCSCITYHYPRKLQDAVDFNIVVLEEKECELQVRR